MSSRKRSNRPTDADPVLSATRQVAWDALWKILLAPPKPTGIVDAPPEPDPWATRTDE